MGDGLCESAVVGHQQQALAVLVETAHGVQAGRDVGHQLHHRLAAQLVAGGGDIAAGLVQSQIVHLLVLLDIDALVVHMEDVAVGVHLVAHLHGVAVDLHAALGDDLLGGAAGAQALLAHNFLNAFFCHDKISLCASRRSNRAAAKPLRHACGVPPPLSRGGLGISKSLISSPEAPLLGELSAKQTERLITAASVSKLRVGSPQLRRRLKFTLLRERQAQRRPSSPLSSAER